MVKKIALASDHGGFALKSDLLEYLGNKGYAASDLGTKTADSCDYPDFSFALAEDVARGKYERGILVCTSGIGMDICANKVKGIRSALCSNVEQAKLSRQHNDTNVLVLSQKFTSPDLAKEICDTWLSTEFEGGRHKRRVDKINAYDNKRC